MVFESKIREHFCTASTYPTYFKTHSNIQTIDPTLNDNFRFWIKNNRGKCRNSNATVMVRESSKYF